MGYAIPAANKSQQDGNRHSQCSFFSASTPAKKEVIPELTCPPSASVVLTDYSIAVTLTGTYTRNNGKISVEYIPQFLDDSVTYQLPNKLIFTQESTGKNFSVLVKARDTTNGNEVKCDYSIMVKGKKATVYKYI